MATTDPTTEDLYFIRWIEADEDLADSYTYGTTAEVTASERRVAAAWTAYCEHREQMGE